MWLVHSTSIYKLENILEDGEIKISKDRVSGRNKVFMSVLFDDMKLPSRDISDDTLIFFPIEILESYNVSHWASAWLGGNPEYQPNGQVVIKYDYKKSAMENAKIWQENFYVLHPQKKYKIYKEHGGKFNEVIFTESIPIGESAFIYVDKTRKIDFDVLDRIDNKKELKIKLGH